MDPTLALAGKQPDGSIREDEEFSFDDLTFDLSRERNDSGGGAQNSSIDSPVGDGPAGAQTRARADTDRSDATESYMGDSPPEEGDEGYFVAHSVGAFPVAKRPSMVSELQDNPRRLSASNSRVNSTSGSVQGDSQHASAHGSTSSSPAMAIQRGPSHATSSSGRYGSPSVSFTTGGMVAMSAPTDAPLVRRKMSKKEKYGGRGERAVSSFSGGRGSRSSTIFGDRFDKGEKTEGLPLVLIGNMDGAWDESALKELETEINKTATVVKSYLTPGQTFGYIQFEDEKTASSFVKACGVLQFKGQNLKTSRSSHTITAKEGGRGSTEGTNPTLVLKNLAFTLEPDTLNKILSDLNVKPLTLNFHVDGTGAFRGMAFAKYKTSEEALAAYNVLKDTEITHRKVKIEFKKKNSKSQSLDFENGPDEEAKFLYEQLMLFKLGEGGKSVLFPSVLSSSQRKRIHSISEKLGLNHQSTGDGERRYISVTKKTPEELMRRSSNATNPISISRRVTTAGSMRYVASPLSSSLGAEMHSYNPSMKTSLAAACLPYQGASATDTVASSLPTFASPSPRTQSMFVPGGMGQRLQQQQQQQQRQQHTKHRFSHMDTRERGQSAPAPPSADDLAGPPGRLSLLPRTSSIAAKAGSLSTFLGPVYTPKGPDGTKGFHGGRGRGRVQK